MTPPRNYSGNAGQDVAALAARWQKVYGCIEPDQEIGNTLYLMIGEVAAALTTQQAEIERLRGSLQKIADRHIPGMPDAMAGTPRHEYVERQHLTLRVMANEALAYDSEAKP